MPISAGSAPTSAEAEAAAAAAAAAATAGSSSSSSSTPSGFFSMFGGCGLDGCKNCGGKKAEKEEPKVENKRFRHGRVIAANGTGKRNPNPILFGATTPRGYLDGFIYSYEGGGVEISAYNADEPNEMWTLSIDDIPAEAAGKAIRQRDGYSSKFEIAADRRTITLTMSVPKKGDEDKTANTNNSNSSSSTPSSAHWSGATVTLAAITGGDVDRVCHIKWIDSLLAIERRRIQKAAMRELSAKLGPLLNLLGGGPPRPTPFDGISVLSMGMGTAASSGGDNDGDDE